MLARGPGSSARRFRHQPLVRHPAQALAGSFAVALVVGTLVLMLPVAVAPAPPSDVLPAEVNAMGGAPAVTALFTAASALAVTGLIVVDTATYWSPVGHAVIYALIQLGGLGVMTAASLIAVLLARRLGLRSRLQTSASLRSVGTADLRHILVGVARLALVVQVAVALVVGLRLWIGYGWEPVEAVRQAVFLAGSSFNNAGFALTSDSLMGFVTDPWVTMPLAAAVIIGGLGFPVLLELNRHFGHRRRWNMNTALVVYGTLALLAVSTVVITALEWTNPATLGPLSWYDKLEAGFVSAVMTRTAGFNVVDVSAMHTPTWLVQDIFMFIGAGPAGTAGGIKLTTFLVLFFIIVAEVRGETAVNVAGKRLARSVHREALTVALLAVALVIGSTWVLMIISPFSLDELLFEVTSAFATVGLSTGITHELPVAGQIMLVVLMFLGRLGPVTVASALALRERHLLYELPKERPVIG